MHLLLNKKKKNVPPLSDASFNFARWDFSSIGGSSYAARFQEKQEETGWQEGKRSRLLLSRETDKADCSGESKWYGWQESFQSGFSFISNAYQSGPSNAMHTLTQIPWRMFLQPREFLEEEETTRVRFVERSLNVNRESSRVWQTAVFLTRVRLEELKLSNTKIFFRRINTCRLMILV